MHPPAPSIAARPGVRDTRVMDSATAARASLAPPVLPDALRLGAVHLAVTDLDRAIAFYVRSIGLRLHGRGDAMAALGAGADDLLVLHEEPGARPPGRHAGLYHVAILHPSRRALAHAAMRLAATATPIGGASDHGISEAIYLDDPDGNGVELAADRPRDAWPDLADPGWAAGPRPLDLHGLLRLAAGEETPAHVDPATTIGHVHLHVGDVERALAHYRDVIGFTPMTHLGSAAFVAAGGYHHHLGLNVWRGHGVPPVPSGVVGLRRWTVVLPTAADVAAVRARLTVAGLSAHDVPGAPGGVGVDDPWGMRLAVVPATEGAAPVREGGDSGPAAV